MTTCVSCRRPADLLIRERVLPSRLAVYRCRSCGIDFFDNAAQTDYWGAPMQDTIYAEEAVANERVAFFRALLARLGALCPAGTLLDLGAGKGEFSVEAVKAGWTVSALEPSDRATAGLRERGVSEVYNCAIEQLRPPHLYDAVAMLDVLEHLTEPGAALSKAASCLKPGGVLVVLTPDGESLIRSAVLSAARSWRSLEWLLKYQYYLPHLCYVGERGLRAYAARSGLQAIRIEKAATPRRFLLSKLRCHYGKYRGNSLVYGAVSVLYPALQLFLRNKLIAFMRKPE